MKLNRILARFWIGAVKSLAHVPLSVRRPMAKVVACLLWCAIPARRRVTLTNLRLCFPEKTEAERRAIAKATYVHLARAALDHGVLWAGTGEEISRLVKFEGLENVTTVEGNRPLIIVAPHFAGLDAAGIAFNLHVRGVSLYQKQRNPEWDAAALAGRKRFSDPVLIAKGGGRHDLMAVIRAMKEGLPFYYLPDMDFGARDAIFVPFFGVPAATLAMCGRLAKVTKAKVCLCIAEMTEEGYVVHVSAPWENYPQGDDVADTVRIVTELESWIRKLPDQYLWTHRRFKTRPEGEPSVY